MPTVGQILRQRREALGLTLDALAKQVGATKSYLSMIENHRVANPPSDELLTALERALDIANGELIRAAQWAKTPASVRQQLHRLAVEAERGQDLARWLKASTAPGSGGRGKSGGASAGGGGAGGASGGRNLDKLFRSGELARRVNSALGESGVRSRESGEPAPKSKGAAGATGGSSGGTSGGASGGAARLRPEGSLDPHVPVRYQVPLINRVAAGYPTEFTDLDYPVRVADEYVACPDLADPQAFAARVVGDSMLPDYREGDVVVFSPAAPVTDGSDCFVRLEPDHHTTFKRVFTEPPPPDAADSPAGGTHLRLQPLNPKFPATVVDRRNVSGLYKAVWRISKLP